jgi:hypothetical protein
MLAKVAAMLLAAVDAGEGGCAAAYVAVDAGEGGCAAACCGGCWRRRLHCCLLRWVLAKVAAMLLAAVGAGEGGCTAACCGGCWRRWLRCCMSRCALAKELALQKREKRKALDVKSAGTQHRHPRGKSPPKFSNP